MPTFLQDLCFAFRQLLQNPGFTAGNLVDDLFFFVEGDGARAAALYVDEVVLFDAGSSQKSEQLTTDD